MGKDAVVDQLLVGWTLVDADWSLIGNKADGTRLGFALMVKFSEQNARFPGSADDFSVEAIGYVADQVNVAPMLLTEYGWSSRTGTYHRKQIRGHFGGTVDWCV